MSSYEFTAFTESDLVGGDNISRGTTFTMPGSATVEMTVEDDDSILSGDYYGSARDYSGQTAEIQSADGTSLGNGGQIYADKYFWVSDQNGNWYVMIEIEQEGSNDEYFTFLNDGNYTTPPAGAILSVCSESNACGSWLNYDNFGAGDALPETGSITGRVFNDLNADGIEGVNSFVEGQTYTIEAEDMDETGFHTVSGAQASGGELLKLNGCNGNGEISTTFNGNSGTYDFALSVQDEQDGKSTIVVKVNGVYVDTIVLDRDSDGWGSDNDGFSIFTIEGVELSAGDTIELSVDGDAGEWVRIDKLDLIGHDQGTTELDPPVSGATVKLVDMDGAVVATTTTDADGNYTFGDVAAGDYQVMVVNPDGTEFTLQNAGNDDALDSDVDAGGLSGVISVGSGQHITDVDAGLVDASEPEVVLEANNDFLTVSETEGANDLDGNVLANDTMDGAAYTGNVAAVAGSADNVGTWIEGSNGGKIKILADGSYDFDAAGQFDALNDGETAQTTFTYQIAEDGSVVPTQNILFVLDVSNSTVALDGENAFVGAGVGDVNNDGRADTVLDAQISAAKALIADMRAQGVDPANVNVGIVTFSGVDTTGGSAYNSATVDSQVVGTFNLGDAALDGALNGVLSGSWTNYEAGLGEAESWFNTNANASDENVMYFLSDGRPIVGYDANGYIEQDQSVFLDEVSRIEDGFGASIYAIGVGENASMDALNLIDNSGNGAAQVSSVSELSAELVSAHEFIVAADTATITVTVEGLTSRVANDDVIVVSESETAGDIEAVNGAGTSVLDNDVTGSGPFDNTVATVNGTVTNVNAFIDGSDGGKARINADGTVDFDAAGDFDYLRDGETAETTFTYTIQGGETATIVVQVQGETDFDANNDVIVVSESETSGDVDGNVLTNDTEENGAYTGDVLAVNGDDALVGVVIDGDNGGSLVINQDGSMDFSADGDFDALDLGDVGTTSFTYEIEGGETATVTFEVQGEANVTPVQVVNVAILLQASATMYAQGDNQNFVNDWADWNGNGVENEQMDMAYLAVADYMPEAFAAADAGGYEINVSFVKFGGSGNEYFTATESNWQGKLQAKISSDTSADYGQAFENATTFFDDFAQTDSADAGSDVTNLLFFLGNGQQTAPWQAELAAMKDSHDVIVDAFMTDLVVDLQDPNLQNLSALDDDGIVLQVYADDEDDALGFGMAQNMLITDDYLG